MNYFDLERTIDELDFIVDKKHVSIIEVLFYAAAIALPTVVISTNSIIFYGLADKIEEFVDKDYEIFIAVSLITLSSGAALGNWLNFMIIVKLLLGYLPLPEMIAYALLGL